LGFVVGCELYNLVLFRLDGDGTPIWFYVTVVVLAVAGGVVACWLHDIILILSTAIGGAYMGIKMIGIMIGNYPDEASIAQKIISGEFTSMPWYDYLYIFGQIAVGIVGVVVQCIIKKRSEKPKVDNRDYEGLV